MERFALGHHFPWFRTLSQQGWDVARPGMEDVLAEAGPSSSFFLFDVRAVERMKPPLKRVMAQDSSFSIRAGVFHFEALLLS